MAAVAKVSRSSKIPLSILEWYDLQASGCIFATLPTGFPTKQRSDGPRIIHEQINAHVRSHSRFRCTALAVTDSARETSSERKIERKRRRMEKKPIIPLGRRRTLRLVHLPNPSEQSTASRVSEGASKSCFLDEKRESKLRQPNCEAEGGEPKNGSPRKVVRGGVLHVYFLLAPPRKFLSPSNGETPLDPAISRFTDRFGFAGQCRSDTSLSLSLNVPRECSEGVYACRWWIGLNYSIHLQGSRIRLYLEYICRTETLWINT